jgi:hypothetical protein
LDIDVWSDAKSEGEYHANRDFETYEEAVAGAGVFLKAIRNLDKAQQEPEAKE